MSKKQKKTDDISFEDAMKNLEEIVSKLEDNDLSLDKSIQYFEKGMELAQFCEESLSKATGRVEKVMNDFKGKKKLTPIRESEIDEL